MSSARPITRRSMSRRIPSPPPKPRSTTNSIPPTTCSTLRAPTTASIPCRSTPAPSCAISRAEGFEVTQAIQNLANDIALVAKKTTYVRAYATQIAGPSTPNVEVRLLGTVGGLALPGSPLKPVNGIRGLVNGARLRPRQAQRRLVLPAAAFVDGKRHDLAHAASRSAFDPLRPQPHRQRVQRYRHLPKPAAGLRDDRAGADAHRAALGL